MQIVLDKSVKFSDPRFNCSREIPPEAIRSGIFDSFFCNNFRPEADSDVISSVVVEYVGVDFPVNLTVLRVFEPLTSDGRRTTTTTTNDAGGHRSSHKAERHIGDLPKNRNKHYRPISRSRLPYLTLAVNAYFQNCFQNTKYSTCPNGRPEIEHVCFVIVDLSRHYCGDDFDDFVTFKTK